MDELLILPVDKIPEAEVSLRLAFFLIEGGHVVGDVSIGIDGSQVKTNEVVHFPLVEFMSRIGWHSHKADSRWQGDYRHANYSNSIRIHSRPGEGDVVAMLTSGRKLWVESKKGPLFKTNSSPEYKLMREAIGQLVTIEVLEEDSMLAVAVPLSEKSRALAVKWREFPAVKKLGLEILIVSREGDVFGFEG